MCSIHLGFGGSGRLSFVWAPCWRCSAGYQSTSSGARQPDHHPWLGLGATHSFVVGLLLLELLHHDAALLVLAPLVLKPDSDHSGAEAGHLH